MKKTIRILGLSSLTVLLIAWGSLSACANVVTLTFEGLQDLEPINDYYNGGFGGMGSGPGPNYGISFTPDSLAIISKYNGGTGNFHGSMAPSPNSCAFFLSGAGDTMNVSAGFTTGFSFFYTAPIYPGTVTVWSGLNGTGSLLATLDLPLTPDTVNTTGEHYDGWMPAGVAFAGTAESAIFTGTANYIGFDNITLGSQTPGGVPDGGATALLLGIGVLCLAGLRRMA